MSKSMTDKERLAAMRKLGVRWKKGHAVPTYPFTMTPEQKSQADDLYDEMRETFIDQQAVRPESSGPLTERRGPDRQRMANELTRCLTNVGATVSVDPILTRDRRIMLRVNAPGGAYVTVEFDGHSVQPDVHVVTWNIESDAFKRGVRFAEIGDVNPYHRAKASRVAYGYTELHMQLLRDVQRFVTGAGYQQV